MKTPMIMVGAQLAVASALLLAGCGGNKGTSVKTPEERLEEQLALADEQLAEEEEQSHMHEESQSDSEEAAEFDEEYAKHELKRATLNAQDCPNVYAKEQLTDYQPGTATVTLTFDNEGSVKQASVNAQYQDTTVGNCVLRAMRSVHVKKFEGPEKTMEWKFDLGESKPREDKKPEAKKPEAKK